MEMPMYDALTISLFKIMACAPETMPGRWLSPVSLDSLNVRFRGFLLVLVFSLRSTSILSCHNVHHTLRGFNQVNNSLELRLVELLTDDNGGDRHRSSQDANHNNHNRHALDGYLLLHG